MTRNEIRLAAAKKRLDKANATFNGICKQANDAVRSVRHKYAQKERAAAAALVAAREEVTRLELRSHGITPMHTIVRWFGGDYAVWITSSGYAALLPVTAKNVEHRGKSTRKAPYTWAEVQLTDRVLVVGE